jgi:hypothetical protein
LVLVCATASALLVAVFSLAKSGAFAGVFTRNASLTGSSVCDGTHRLGAVGAGEAALGAGGGGAVVAASALHFPHEGVDQAPFILYFPFTTALSVILLDLL